MTATNEVQHKKWLDGLFEAWRNKDFERIAAIFSSCTLYMEDPFYPLVHHPKEIGHLWEEIANQSDIHLDGDVLVSTAGSAAFRWQATFESEGKLFELDGVYIAKFNKTGECLEFQQWTVEKE